MKIGVVSDTHINSPLEPLSAQMLTRFQQESVQMILHAGDILHDCVLDELSAVAEVKAVAGNMDPVMMKAKLPHKLVTTADGVRIGLIHGGGPPMRLGERLLSAFDGEEIDVLVFGHSHEPRNEAYKGVLLFNPGSARGGRGGYSASFGILTVENDQVTGEIITIGG